MSLLNQQLPERQPKDDQRRRLRAKLAASDCAQLIATVPEGGYRLVTETPLMFVRQPAGSDALDRYVRAINWHAEAQNADAAENSLANHNSPLA